MKRHQYLQSLISRLIEKFHTKREAHIQRLLKGKK